MQIRIGDRITIIKYKFPELNPDYPIEKEIKIKGIFKEETYKYTIQNLDTRYQGKKVQQFIGRTGTIIEISDKPITEYEIKTGELQKYRVRIDKEKMEKDDWNYWFYPEEIKLK